MPFDASKYGKFRIRMKITPNAKAGLFGVEKPSMLRAEPLQRSPLSVRTMTGRR